MFKFFAAKMAAAQAAALSTGVVALAETTPVDVSGLLAPITSALGDFSTSNLTTILVAGVGIAAGLVLLWFGFNYIKRKLMGALKKGKL